MDAHDSAPELSYIATSVRAEVQGASHVRVPRGFRLWQFARLPSMARWLIGIVDTAAPIEQAEEEFYVFANFQELLRAHQHQRLSPMRLFMFVSARTHRGMFADAILPISEVHRSADGLTLAFVAQSGLVVLDPPARHPASGYPIGLAPAFRQGRVVYEWSEEHQPIQ